MSARDIDGGQRVPAGTLVMATHNRAERAIASVERALDLPEGWPIVVVDDASEDATATRLRRRFGDAISVIALERNVGAAARNVGVDVATTPLVAFVDDDSWWEPGSLRRAADVLANTPDVGLVAAHMVVEPGGRSDPVNDAMATSPLEPTDAGPSVLGFLACAAVVRRQAFLDVGGFASILHIGGEEALLAMDLRSAGWTLTYCRDVLAGHAPQMADDGREDRRAQQLRNAALIAVMRRPVGVVIEEIAGVTRAAVHDTAARKAIAGIVRRMAPALAQRRPVVEPIERELRLLSD